jgi:hypothetical protein
MKRIRDRNDKLVINKKKVYALMLGQCGETLKQKLEAAQVKGRSCYGQEDGQAELETGVLEVFQCQYLLVMWWNGPLFPQWPES